jgi:hypothetical protein
MSSEVSVTVEIIRSMSSTVSTVWNGDLVAFDFFHNEGFIKEPFLFLDVFSSERGSLGGVTSSCLCLSSPPSSSSFYTLSPPPSSSESDVVSFDVLLNSCTPSFFFFLLLLGASYSSRVTTGLPMRSGSDSSS